jgi:hypothetical protein
MKKITAFITAVLMLGNWAIGFAADDITTADETVAKDEFVIDLDEDFVAITYDDADEDTLADIDEEEVLDVE